MLPRIHRRDCVRNFLLTTSTCREPVMSCSKTIPITLICKFIQRYSSRNVRSREDEEEYKYCKYQHNQFLAYNRVMLQKLVFKDYRLTCECTKHKKLGNPKLLTTRRITRLPMNNGNPTLMHTTLLEQEKY